MKKWKAIFNKQKSIYEVYPEKAGDMRICAVVNQIDEGKIARLIATAPDLLTACKIAAEALCDHLQYDDGESLERDGFEAVTQAIAKAEAV